MTVLTRFVLVFITDLMRCRLPYMINLKRFTLTYMTDLTQCLHSFMTVLSSCCLNYMTDLTRCVYSYMIVLTRFVLFYIVFLTRCILTFLTSFLRDFSYCDVFFEVSSFAEKPTENVSLFHGIAIIVLSKAKYNICCVCLAFFFLSYTFLGTLGGTIFVSPTLYLIID